MLIRPSLCGHPIVGGATDEKRCALCPEYRGSLRGLGDVVASVTRATGVEAVAKLVGCGGCAKRQAALNAALPFTDESEKG
jgi:hypothetical protein